MSPLELTAAALGLINIVLIARRTVLNYPFGIAMVVLYAMLFARTRLIGGDWAEREAGVMAAVERLIART